MPTSLPSTPKARPTNLTGRFSRALFVVGVLALPCLAQAQIFEDPDWKETQAPPPPAFSESRLVPIDMPAYMSLKFGVDPATIKITGDGIVRYVVVATRPNGPVNAFYEAVRCATAELKIYARYSGTAWEPVKNPEWKKLDSVNTTYSRELAKQGVCRGQAPRESVTEIVYKLKTPFDPSLPR